MPRAVIYLRPDQNNGEDEQRTRCMLYAAQRHHEVVAIASDVTGSDAGWRSVLRTIQDGRAELVIVPPGVTIPRIVTIEVAAPATQERRPNRI
jgi:hypothetical protein